MNLRSIIKVFAAPALLLVIAVVMLRASGDEPTADAIPGAVPPVFEDGPDGPVVRNAEPQQRLRIYDIATNDAIRIFAASALDSLTGDRNTVQRASDILAVRSPRDFALAPVRPDEPLVERTDADGRDHGGFGEVQVPANAFLGQLVNAGWIAATEDGGVIFAAALKPEVMRFGPDGALLWASERPTPIRVAPPALVRSGSSVTAKFRELQHAIARGPDSRFYILGGANGDSVRLDVLDGDGVFQRTAWIPRGYDVFVDRHGRVAVVAPGESSRGGEARAAFYSFDLESLDGRARVRLADYAGKVVVINVWASWCGPCRQEMPALDRLAARLDTSEVVVIGLNEDVDVDDRLPAMERVVAIRNVEEPVAYPFSELREERVVNDEIDRVPVVVFWVPGAASSVDARSIADGREVGSTAVFDRRAGEQILTFEPVGDGRFRDRETGSVWTIAGTAETGPLSGERLEAVVHGDFFWFAWAVFKPDTRIWRP